jgi:TP901-1 family phage major tail protein
MSGPTNLKQAGKLFKVELQNTGSPATYTAFLSARSSDFTINNGQVDVTALDSAGWKQLLQGAGIQDFAITLQGVFADNLQEQTAAGAAMANTFVNLKLISGNTDTWAGSFAISSYKRAGTFNGEETYSMTLNSSGVVTYTPHA